MGAECIFCRIVEGKEKCWKIYEDEICVAFLDAFPVTEGHTIVATKKHYPDIFETEDDVFTHIFKVTRKIAMAMKKSLGAEFVNVIIAPGVIKHAFVHVVPRYDYDLMGPIPDMENKRSLSEEEMEIIARKLRGGLGAGKKDEGKTG